MRKLWVASFLCWIWPLAAGIIVYTLFYYTLADWLIIPGLYVMYAGLICTVIGLVCLTIYTIWFRNQGLKKEWRNIGFGYFLLLSNFPVAILIFFAVYDIESSSKVWISNTSVFQITDIYWYGPGSDTHDIGYDPSKTHYIGKVRPGGTKRFFIKDEGTINFEMTVGTKTVSGMLFYVDSGAPQSAKITVGGNGNQTISVLEHIDK